MPKTLEGINAGPFKKTTVVPQPGEQRIAANVEVPVQDLLNNAAYLLRLIAELTSNLEGHTHAIATDTAAGFMAPGDRQRINELLVAIQNHSHSIATTAAAGFMSSADKTKLNGIESGADKVTRAKVEAALGIKYGELIIPATTLAADQARTFSKSMPGVKFEDSIAISETSSNDTNFNVAYHAAADAVEIRVRNISGASRAYSAGINFMVFSR